MNELNKNETLHWLWATQLQIVRFVESFNDNIMLPEKRGAKKPHLTINEKRIYYKSSTEAHFLVISSNNLIKAIKKLGLTNFGISEDITILRDNLEHWEENKIQFKSTEKEKKRSAKKYAEKFPNKTPWSFSLDSQQGLIIGGILIVGDLLIELSKLEEVLLNN
jgi:hypothetical protein